MTPYRGRFNESGLPCIELDVVGKKGQARIEAIIDTGYSGTLSITSDIEKKIGLTRLGVGRATMANGIPTSYVECLGTIVIDDLRMLDVIIDVELKGKILLGTAFLKQANLCFKCHPRHSLAELDHQS